MRIEQVSCDVCGKQKAETNHWFVIIKEALTFSVVAPVNVLHVVVSEDAELLDLCGEQCVLRKVSELIGVPTVDVSA